MAWDKGFDFRADNSETNFVDIDPTDCTYFLNTDTYTGSVIRNSVAFGVTDNGSGELGSRNRAGFTNARIAGILYMGGIHTAILRIDLPATGTYDIWAAFGDHDNAQTIGATLKDNATTFATISGSTGAVNTFIDASGAVRTAAQWLADSARGGTKITRAFASTILNIELDGSVGATPISHLFISQVSVSATAKPASYYAMMRH